MGLSKSSCRRAVAYWLRETMRAIDGVERRGSGRSVRFLRLDRVASYSSTLAHYGRLLLEHDAFPLEHPALLSLCKGLTDDGCGDEVDPGQKLCSACLRSLARPDNSEWAAQYRDGSGGTF